VKTLRIKSSDGIELCCESAGSGAPALLFVHGWSCNRHFFAQQFNHFSANHECIALDLPGHGQSGRSSRVWSIDSYAQVVAEVLAAAVAGKAVLIGHSMAGAVVVEAARRAPEKVAAVVLADTHVFDYGHLDEPTIQGIVAQMESDLPAFIAGLVNNTLPESAAPQLRNWIQEQMSCADPRVAIPSLESLLRWDALPSLKQLRVPLYAINASTINETARQRYRHILREHLMREAGHFLQLENPQGFNRALQAILDEVKLHSPTPTDSEVVV
jgi:pimeloyl-ACP methyl ester carboxylesterase